MREDNVKIFTDTEKLCKTNEKLMNAIEMSNKNQKLILEKEKIEVDRKVFEKPCKILVTKNRTFESSMQYPEKNVAVLNFASATNPGGGVVNGSSAQEECLCRCSTLYFNLIEEKMKNGFYVSHRKQKNPLHNDDIIYTPEVVIFKTDTSYPKLMKKENWQTVNVITCAAPNLRERPSNAMNPHAGDRAVKLKPIELENLLTSRIKRIFDVAAQNENEVLILGAFGCGAFRNPPEIVAKVFIKVMQEYLHHFDTIEYAVYHTEREKANYEVFQRIIK